MSSKYVMRQLDPNMICAISFHNNSERETTDINEAFRCLEYWNNHPSRSVSTPNFQIEEEN
jgi:hypothetical protein